MLTPPARSPGLHRPAALQSAAEVRRQALAGYKLRTWVDAMLAHSERFLGLAAVAVFAFYVLDGWGRDTLHALQARAVVQPATAAHADRPPVDHQPMAPVQQAAALPGYAASVERGETAPDYLVPGQQPAPRPAPSDPRPARVQIPKIGVDSPVVEVFVQDGTWQVADYAAGYHHGSALPGDAGNTVLAGHAGIRGAVFRSLGELTAGDEIYLDTGEWRFTYRVRESRSVWPDQVEVMDPTPTRVLTLITCTNWDTQRLVVVADLVGARQIE